MTYTMKRGNKKISYQDLLSESNQAMIDATEAERKANVEEEMANSPTDFKKELETRTDRVTPDSSSLKYERDPEEFKKRKSKEGKIKNFGPTVVAPIKPIKPKEGDYEKYSDLMKHDTDRD